MKRISYKTLVFKRDKIMTGGTIRPLELDDQLDNELNEHAAQGWKIAFIKQTIVNGYTDVLMYTLMREE